MEASRGRKGKQGRWQLTLGIKDTIFAGLGLAGLMMMAFALGALAGRGDIYRVFYNWGLLAPEASTRTGQWTPPPAAVPVTPAVAPAAAPAPAAPPVTGSVVPPASSSPTASPTKKSKSGAATAQKARDEEMRRVRQEVAKKLKFQNSFDTAPKTAKASQKGKPAGAAKPAPAPIKVAQFRDAKAAKAKVAEMKKKGEKVTLKEGKDAQGALYTIYKQAPAAPKEGEKVAQKPKPAGAKKTKTKAE